MPTFTYCYICGDMETNQSIEQWKPNLPKIKGPEIFLKIKRYGSHSDEKFKEIFMKV